MTRHSPQDLGLRPWPSLRADRPLVLVPVGSVEQHGPHLPLATDAIVAAAVAREAARVLAARGAQVVVAPTADEVQLLTRRPSDPLTARVASLLVDRAAGPDEAAANKI